MKKNRLATAVLVAAIGIVGNAWAGGELVRFDKDQSMGETAADKALIYVVRPAKKGYAVKSFFFCDEDLFGINKGRSYFFAQVDPGKHIFWSKSENVDALEVEVEAGETYYFQQLVKMGAMKARTKLVLLTQTEGNELLGKCENHGTLTAEGEERGVELANSHFKNAEKNLNNKADKNDAEE